MSDKQVLMSEEREYKLRKEKTTKLLKDYQEF